MLVSFLSVGTYRMELRHYLTGEGVYGGVTRREEKRDGG